MKLRSKILVLAAVIMAFTGCVPIFTSTTGSVDLHVTGASIGGGISAQSLIPLATEEEAEDPNQFKEVWVNIVRIEAKRDDKWVTLAEFNDDEGLIDLMSLRFQSELVGKNVKLDAGAYTAIRLVTKSDNTNKIVFNDDRVAELKIPSNELKPDIGNFTVTAGQTTSLILNVDMKYFVERGNDQSRYNVNPKKIIRLVKLEQFGALKGEIKLPAGIQLPENFEIKLELFTPSNVSMGKVTLEKGVYTYEFPMLAPGQYKLVASAYLGDMLNVTGEVLVTIETNKTTPAGSITLNVNLALPK